ncbi:MAG TPA: cell division protein ZapA [Bacillota bacterium]|jgi:cell division protein ZapA|nr:cell division protein ZapA [Peptococcaceae bacterium MAG4]NLW37849.1 cell division protein ZapA [Peptococcaceae bacterium]HPU35394.1 cell division protein ZapA [Bacillota bacterium]HPZ43732.1 cell division protein ZapA [Bacillota bacterium]HQD75133.1 cell division protein ZapA [Bacillota bacterium]
MASQESRVEVEIFGENYIVKGDQSPERIMMLAQYVNRKMMQVAARNPRLSRTHTAVLAALNIAEELMKLQDEQESIMKLLESEQRNTKRNS